MPSINSKERAVFVAVSVAACAGCVMGIGTLLLYQRLQRESRGLVEPIRVSSCMAPPPSLDYHRGGNQHHLTLLTRHCYSSLLPAAGASTTVVQHRRQHGSWNWWSNHYWPSFTITPPSLVLPTHPRRDLVALRRELEDLRGLVNSLRNFKPPSSAGSTDLQGLAVAEEIANGLYENHVAKRPSTTSSPSPDAELEFFDAASEQPTSDYDGGGNNTVLSHSASNGFLHSSTSSSDNVKLLYQKADALLATHDEEGFANRRRAYELLKKYYSQNTSNYEYLWRLSRATYMYGRTLMGTDEEKRKNLCIEAKDYAFAALSLNDEDADVHKWCALTVGTMGDFVGLRQKLADGWTFKQHIDIAVRLRSADGILRHLSGRWLYGVANLSWLERKVATAIFSNIPTATYDQALAEFLEAARSKPHWKENMLYIALCYHNKGDTEQAKQYLERAKDMVPVSLDDLAAEKDIEKLWRDYYYK